MDAILKRGNLDINMHIYRPRVAIAGHEKAVTCKPKGYGRPQNILTLLTP